MTTNNDEAASLDKSQISAVKSTFDLYTSEKFVDPVSTVSSKPRIKKDEVQESIKVLKPELQSSLAEIQKSVSQEKVDNLLNASKSKDLDLFKSDDPTMTSEHQKNIMKKLSKWESTPEINVANASVVTSWLDKFGKLK